MRYKLVALELAIHWKGARLVTRVLNLRGALAALIILAVSQTAFGATECDTCPLLQDIATSAYQVHVDVSAARSALLQTDDPTARAAFAILDPLDAKARQIHTVALVALHFVTLGSAADDDSMAIAFFVMMEAAKSARDDLKAIMDGVKGINASKQSVRMLVKAIQASPAVAESVTTLIKDTALLLTLFEPGCVDCDSGV